MRNSLSQLMSTQDYPIVSQAPEPLSHYPSIGQEVFSNLVKIQVLRLVCRCNVTQSL